MSAIFEDEDRSYPTEDATRAPSAAMYSEEDAPAAHEPWSPLDSSPAARGAGLARGERAALVDALARIASLNRRRRRSTRSRGPSIARTSRASRC